MKYRALIKKSGEWWIGWLIDLPGVNAQEKTKVELIESLRFGAEDMLDTEVPFEPDAEMTTIDITDPLWAKPAFENLTVSQTGSR
jgi:predicted RNase H-like HicB family nuclease